MSPLRVAIAVVFAYCIAAGCQDTAYSRSTASTDEVSDPDDGCTVLERIDTDTIVADNVGLAQPVIAGDRVYVERIGPRGIQIVAVDVATGQNEAISDEESDSFVVDGRGDTVVYVEQRNRDSFLHARRGSEDVLLASPAVVGFGHLYSSPHVVHDDEVVFATYQSVELWTGERGKTLSLQTASNGPYLRNGAASWLSHDGRGLQVMLWRDGELRTVTNSLGNNIGIAMSQDWLAWIDPDEQVVGHRLDDGEQRRLSSGHEQRCLRLAASDDLVAMVCRSPDQPGDILRVFDGGQLQDLRQAEGPILALAADGHSVAWAEFDDPAAECEPAEGRVRYLAHIDGEPVDLAPIYTGYACGGALVPYVNLRLQGDLVAWNHAQPEGSTDNDRVGVAILQRTACRR